MCGACRALKQCRLQMVILVLPFTIYTAGICLLLDLCWVIDQGVLGVRPKVEIIRLPSDYLSVQSGFSLGRNGLSVDRCMSSCGCLRARHPHVRHNSLTHSGCRFVEFLWLPQSSPLVAVKKSEPPLQVS